ncbi:MAG: hypothetical protein K9L74_07215, partial [Candidatus Izimaplasma sp.]|nr:hypothetical protein [Candidatus Izimaplasma bacterium]
IRYLKRNPIQPFVMIVFIAGLVVNYYLEVSSMVFFMFIFVHFIFFMTLYALASLVEVGASEMPINIFGYDAVRNKLLIIAHPLAFFSMIGIFVFAYFNNVLWHYISLGLFVYSGYILSFFYEIVPTNKNATMSHLMTKKHEREARFYENQK